MANYCNNQLFFFGEEESINKVMECFYQLILEEARSHEGVVPEFIKKVKESYFFNISIDGQQISFETKNISNPNEVKAIADKFGVGFELDTQELGSGIYSKYKFDRIAKDLTHFSLTQSDFDNIKLEGEVYKWKDIESESEYEILDFIFEEKFKLSY